VSKYDNLLAVISRYLEEMIGPTTMNIRPKQIVFYVVVDGQPRELRVFQAALDLPWLSTPDLLDKYLRDNDAAKWLKHGNAEIADVGIRPM
jgi:hypothetical protein